MAIARPDITPDQLPEQTIAQLSKHERSWVEISMKALAHNIAQYRAIVGPQRQLAVIVKSNAYGHGLLQIAHACDRHQDVDWIFTVNLSEAITLRKAGIVKPIFVLSYIDEDPELAIIHNIDVVLYDFALLDQLQAYASYHKKIARVHIKVDTGLSRMGLLPYQAYRLAELAQEKSHIRLQGIFTHLAESEKTGEGFVAQQVACLQRLRERLTEAGIEIQYYHFSCTAALVSVLDPHYNIGRLGLGIYGLWPSQENKQLAQERFPTMKLEPVLVWKTKIVQLKTIAADSWVGYARTHRVTRDSVIALLPVGYWEGYDRGLSNKGMVLIRAQAAPVIGRISMNVTIVDVTDIPQVMVGDEVTLLGNHPELSADAIAAKIGTINWEVVTRINPLLPRIMVP